MKKLYFVLSFLFVSAMIFAQEDANFYKNEGNNAYKAKDYAKAFASYASAIELLTQQNEVDTPLVYNTGYCGYKAKEYEKSLEYFNKAAELQYKESKPYQYLISVYMKIDQLDNAEETVLKGIEIYSDDAKLKELASTVYLKKGLVFYNEGNTIKKAANDSGLNKTDAEAFKAEYAKADEQYGLALPLIEKAYKYNSGSDKVKQALKNVYISLDMNDKADAL